MNQLSLGDELLMDEVSNAELEEKMSQNTEISDVLESESESEEENNDDEDENPKLEGGGDESEEYEEDNEDFGVEEQKVEINPKLKPKQLEEILTDDDEDEEDEQDENNLMKFDKEIRKNYLVDFHPEILTNNYDEIQSLVNITRNEKGIIIDDFHKTIPFLTKYEKTRVLGQRTKQINSGSKPYIDIQHEFDNKRIIDGSLIALKELELKRIPFIIRRPLPNGSSEYWRLNDLQLII